MKGSSIYLSKNLKKTTENKEIKGEKGQLSSS